MNILLLHDFSGVLGGGETHVKQLNDLLSKNGYKVTIYYGSENVSKLSIINSLFGFNHFFKTLLLIRRNKIDVVHIHGSLYELGPLIYLLKFFVNCRVVKTFHAYQFFCPRTYGIYEDMKPCEFGFNYTKCLYKNCISQNVGKKYLLRYWYRRFKIFIHRGFVKMGVDHFICPSDDLTNKIKVVLGLDESRVTKVANFSNLVANLKGDWNGDTILFVGRVNKQKGINVLLRSLFDLKNLGHNVSANIVGDGPELEIYLKMKIELGLDNVNFIGRITHEEIGKYYMKAICVVIPSTLMENNPLVGLEAMSYSRPIIASNIGGLSDIVESGVNGYLFPMGNHRHLTSLLEKLIEDKKLAQMLGENGHNRLRNNFSEKIFLDKIRDIYEK